MKTHVGIWTVGAVLALCPPLAADGQGMGIANPGSPHNFTDDIGVPELSTSGGWNLRDELCRVCHVPHDHNRAQMYGTNGLLWNHEVSSATYTMYASNTLDGAIASQPTGHSKLCLGCHDGTVAIDTFDKYTNTTTFIDDYSSDYQVPGALYQSGGVLDLGSTHPISIIYDEFADPGLHPKTNPIGGSGAIEDVLENGDTLQCSSCHDVHDQPGESVPGTHLLRVGQKAPATPSGLCLTCHIK